MRLRERSAREWRLACYGLVLLVAGVALAIDGVLRPESTVTRVLFGAAAWLLAAPIRAMLFGRA